MRVVERIPYDNVYNKLSLMLAHNNRAKVLAIIISQQERKEYVQMNSPVIVEIQVSFSSFLSFSISVNDS